MRLCRVNHSIRRSASVDRPLAFFAGIGAVGSARGWGSRGREFKSRIPDHHVYLVLMNSYDAIVILGSQPDPDTWQFPSYIYDCLQRAKLVYDEGTAPLIITSGKWSIALENKGIKQPFRECDLAANYLKLIGMPEDKILKEGESKDTISNLYYLKTELFKPRAMQRLLFVVADFRVPRLKFLCERILGSDHKVEFASLAAEISESYDEPNTMKVQKEFLEPMKTGNHEWLADKFYSAPMYKYWAEHDKKL